MLQNLILVKISEPELKQALIDSYKEIKPIIEEFQAATQLKEIKTLNPEISKREMDLISKIPNMQEAARLLEELDI